MVYHHTQHPRKRALNTSFTKSGLAPCGSTPPSRCDSISPYFDDFARSDSCNFFRFFRFFRLSNIPSNHGAYLTFRSLNLYRPPLVARYAPSEAPEPLITSVLCGCCCSHRCRRILTFGEEILALRSSATSQHRNIATPTTANHHQRRRRHAAANDRWYTGYRM